MSGAARTAGGRGPLSAWVWLVVGLQLVALVSTSTRYGYHRDEFYFIVAGSHPALGYPDQPPIVPLIAWSMHQLSASLAVLRLPSALASCATSLLAGLVAREIGGAGRAQVIAVACTAASGFALAVGHIVSTTTFDMLSTTAFGWLVIRAITRAGGPSLLVAGVVVGLGMEAKPQVGLVALVSVIMLGILGPRHILRSGWAAAGAVCAVAIAAPYMIWQQQHGWPQVTVAQNIAGSQEGGRVGFIPFQLVMVGPLLVPVWVAGLLAPLRRRSLRFLRFIPASYAALAAIYLIGDGKAYYLASLYPVLLGVGSVPTADWIGRSRRRLALLATAIWFLHARLGWSYDGRFALALFALNVALAVPLLFLLDRGRVIGGSVAEAGR